jgi:predicted RNA-binding Zn-ribbon protein involved in translation (DUF1610 family)
MKATFYQATLTPLTENEVKDIYLKGSELSERMEKPDGTCPDCGDNKWWILPVDCIAVREGGKPYIECLNCGYQTHL